MGENSEVLYTTEQLIKDIGIYTVITITIMRFHQPQLSETELFLKIPQALIWKFN